MSTREFKPAPETSIPGGITDIDLSATLADGTGYPTGPGAQSFVLILDPETSSEEHVLCSGRSGDVVTISSRGYAGTAAVDHDPGCRVRHGFDSVAAQDVHDHLDDTTAVHAASAITFTPVGTIAAENAQSAIAEVSSEAATALADAVSTINDAIDDIQPAALLAVGQTTISTTTSGASMVTIAGTELTVTVPASGQILCRFSGQQTNLGGSGVRSITLNLWDVTGSALVKEWSALPASTLSPWSFAQLATGLTPGASRTYRWQFAVTEGTFTGGFYFGSVAEIWVA